MLRKIFAHGWLRMRRSPTWNQNVVYAIFLGLLGLYFGVQFLALGFFADKIVAEVLPGADPIRTVGVLLMYYFLIDVILRLIMQKFPFLDIKPYLTLPIHKSTLVHSMLIKSLRSFFNFLPLLIIIPFAFKSVLSQEGLATCINFLLCFMGWIVMNNYLSFSLDRFLKTKSWLTILITSLLLTTLYLDFSGIIGLREVLNPIVEIVFQNIGLSLIPLVLAILIYWRLFRFMKGYLYLEDYLPDKRVSEVNPLALSFLDRFGEAGKIMALEAKLIWRNKRSKTILFISLIFLLYPLIFIGDSEVIELMWFKLFLGLFVTGGFALNYGQLMLSWNSPHFDLLLSRGFKIEHIFQAKYYLLALSCIILFLFSMLYGFLDASFWVIIPVMLLFNVGVSIFLYMLLASYNAKRIDPSKGAMFNYEGIGAEHFLIMIPLILLPYLLYLPFSLMGFPNMGIAFIGFIGLLGFIFHHKLIVMATRLFQKNKYKIAAAFRKKE